MNNVKAAFVGLTALLGGTVAAAAADMPMTDLPQFGRDQAAIEDARLVCNGFGRCFHVGPYRGFYGPRLVYPGRPVYAPPLYEGPAYEVRRSYEERRFDGPDYGPPRVESYRRRPDTDGYAGRQEADRRSDRYRRSDDERERETWSHEYRRSEEDDGRY